VRHLAHETDHEVRAIGNQELKREVDVPESSNSASATPRRVSSVSARRTTVGYYEFWPPRRERLRILAELFSDAAEHVVVDDIDLGDVVHLPVSRRVQ
jgi:hypothetical protein